MIIILPAIGEIQKSLNPVKYNMYNINDYTRWRQLTSNVI